MRSHCAPTHTSKYCYLNRYRCATGRALVPLTKACQINTPSPSSPTYPRLRCPGPPCSLFFFNIPFCFALDPSFPLSAGLVPLLILPFRITSPQSAESLVRHRVR
ncbi:hypothetical protein CDV36_009353 [Fusarium kuroshium]|uniref:Uncharacterized protein n=3 Tax=Fusarium solani species complex TaxID=232080 RepID=A0A3M2S1A2_9HYPO|nr:hypothetical protein CDV36_009353 [Fusarium kuroshium]RSL62110.1 hypothetical protein CEP51_013532 [Fusarium floridanum]RSM13416.1 hypothetical protein CEP52_001921 [Fusarium oligoseptatum]